MTFPVLPPLYFKNRYDLNFLLIVTPCGYVGLRKIDFDFFIYKKKPALSSSVILKIQKKIFTYITKDIINLFTRK